MTATAATGDSGPYKGLTFFTEDDAAYFFGRERDRDLIIANLKARRLGLLYGPSGVGKSSLLRAGVAAHLRSVARQDRDEFGSAEFIPVGCSAWRDDPLAAIHTRIAEAASEFGASSVDGAAFGLVPTIEQVSRETGAAILVILDQFEEYFLYHPAESGPSTLAGQLPAAVNHERLPAGFLIAIREDALAQLDRFKNQIPTLFDSFRRVEPLASRAAEEAIRRPVEEYNRLRPADEHVSFEDALVEAVIDQVRSGRVKLEQAGVGSVDGAGRPDAIEAPYLQLVMTRLWAAERADSSTRLRLGTLEALGGAQTIVRSHLDATLDALSGENRETAVRVFHHLVTPSGTKIAHDIPSLVEYTHEPEEQVRDLLQRLEQGDTRIVRSVPPPPGTDGPARFEIFHDVLAPAILDWQRRESTRQLQQEKEAAEREARRQRRRAGFAWTGAVLAFAALLAVISVLYVYSRNESAAADSRRLAADAVQSLDSDPELSTLLALSAVDKSPTAEAQQALRQAFGLTQEEAAFPMGGPVMSVAVSPNGTEVAAAKLKLVEVWDRRYPHRPPTILHPGFSNTIVQHTAVAFSPDGRQLLVGTTAYQGVVNNTAYYITRIVIFDTKTWRVERVLGPAGNPNTYTGDFAYSPNGTVLASVNYIGQLCTYSIPSYVGRCSTPLLQADGSFEPLFNISFDHSGTRIATSAGPDGTVIWSTASLTPLETVDPVTDVGPVGDAALNPSASQLVIAGRQGHVAVLDLTGPQPTVVADFDTDAPVVAFGPNGREILTAGTGGQTTIWDPTTKVETVQLNCRCGQVAAGVFDPTGTPVVVTGSEDGWVRVWDAEPRQILFSSPVFAGPGTPTDLSLIPHSHDVIFEHGGKEGEIANIRTGQTFTGPASDIGVATVHNKTTFVTVYTDGKTQVWSLDPVRLHPTLIKNLGPTGGSLAAMSPDGRWVAVSGGFLVAFLQNVDSSQAAELAGSRKLTAGYTKIAFNPAGTRVILACSDGLARMWSTQKFFFMTGTRLAPYLGALRDPYSTDLTDAQFSPDGKYVVVTDTAGNAIVFDVPTAKVIRTFNAGTNQLNSASFNPSSTEVVTAGTDGVTRIWDVSSGDEIAAFGPVDVPLSGPVTSAVFTASGNAVVTIGIDDTVRFWSTKSAQALVQVEAAARQRVTRGLTPAERSLYKVNQ